MAIFNSYVCLPEGTPHTSIESHTSTGKATSPFFRPKKHTAWRTENGYFDACCLTVNPQIPKISLGTPIKKKDVFFFKWGYPVSQSSSIYRWDFPTKNHLAIQESLIYGNPHIPIFTETPPSLPPILRSFAG